MGSDHTYCIALLSHIEEKCENFELESSFQVLCDYPKRFGNFTF